MGKKLLIGLDLSLNCTGISVLETENNIPKEMQFFRILFDDLTNSSGKKYKPRKIENITDFVYSMPTNIFLDDLILDKTDNNIEQIDSTLKAMICSKKITTTLNQIITDKIHGYYSEIHIGIENFVMPSFGGKSQLKTVGSLIMLQSFIRQFLIRFSLEQKQKITISMPSPTTLKKFFSGKGNATKTDMIGSFIENFDGKKLLPTIDKNKNQIDDVIDSFAIIMQLQFNLVKNYGK